MAITDDDDLKRTKPLAATTWNPYRVLAIDSTKLSSQSQTASLPTASGACRVYSPGDEVDNTYRLIGLIGSGGMGVVFHAQHLILGKEYALKLLSSDKITIESWSRFQAEARVLARLHHPGVVGIHNMGIDQSECPYYVMDLLQGEPLSEVIAREKRLTIKRALGIFIQLADALEAAHQQDIIHRDIKPSNIMIVDAGQNEQVKLVDFGIARLSGKGIERQYQTVAGSVFGTPYYMSPEQSLGESVDQRSDIYSLGCTLFEALTGVPPYCGANAMETVMLHQSGAVPSLSSVYPQGHFDAGLESAVAKMLQKLPEDRYQTMQQLRHDLKRLTAGKTVGTSKHSRIEESELVIGQNFRERLIPAMQSRESEAPSNRFVLIGATSAVLTLGLIVAGTCYWLNTQSQPAPKAAQAIAAEDEWSDGGDDPMVSYLSDHLKKTPMLSYAAKQDGVSVKRFEFPRENCHFGYIRAGDKPPVPARGIIDIPAESPVYIYMQCVCTPFPTMCKKFGKGDVTGLEIVTFKPARVIETIKDWTGLRHLSFFNSYERVEGIDCSTIYRDDLPLIDQLTTLTSLGLCGETVSEQLKDGRQLTGADVTGLQLLHRLDTLMLKEIKDIRPLLVALKQYPNIKTLYLDNIALTDRDIEILSQNDSLQSITIFQNPGVTPQSVAYLARMKGLKQFVIDDKWSDAERLEFARKLKTYRHEDFKTNRHY